MLTNKSKLECCAIFETIPIGKISPQWFKVNKPNNTHAHEKRSLSIRPDVSSIQKIVKISGTDYTTILFTDAFLSLSFRTHCKDSHGVNNKTLRVNRELGCLDVAI